jgi:hypothetical protein
VSIDLAIFLPAATITPADMTRHGFLEQAATLSQDGQAQNAPRNTVTGEPLGLHRSGSVGPNSAMTGTVSNAAKCVIPESFPM